mmetsp:Transcript_608/g.1491  ORF Transcript_608/g.1491 Transcript_608/m.1491 type:complete len:309 (-) Transcript_608:616-1542(-)
MEDSAEKGRPTPSSPYRSFISRTCSVCRAFSASRKRTRSMSCRSLVPLSALLGPSLVEPFSTACSRVFCLSCCTMRAWRSSWAFRSALSRFRRSASAELPPDGLMAPSRESSPRRPSCRRSASTRASSFWLLPTSVCTCALSSRSWPSRRPLRDLSASRFRLNSASAPRSRSTSSCSLSNSSRRFSAALSSTARSFSPAWSWRPPRCGRCGVSPPSAVEAASGPRSRSSRTCRCSCEICAARPFHEMSFGSSATDIAFSIASSVPSSLRRTFFCLCTWTRVSCMSCLTCCSWLDATRYLFFQSSAPTA